MLGTGSEKPGSALAGTKCQVTSGSCILFFTRFTPNLGPLSSKTQTPGQSCPQALGLFGSGAPSSPAPPSGLGLPRPGHPGSLFPLGFNSLPSSAIYSQSGAPGQGGSGLTQESRFCEPPGPGFSFPRTAPRARAQGRADPRAPACDISCSRSLAQAPWGLCSPGWAGLGFAERAGARHDLGTLSHFTLSCFLLPWQAQLPHGRWWRSNLLPARAQQGRGSLPQPL